MIEKRLGELGIKLPNPEITNFQYIPMTVHQDTVFLAGQIPKIGGELYVTGKIGAEVSLTQAKESSRICVLQGLAWVQHYFGDLDRIERILRMDAYLAVVAGFDRLSEIVDAASELLISIFGEKGRHPRSVIGVLELPRKAPVLIELTIAMKKE